MGTLIELRLHERILRHPLAALLASRPAEPRSHAVGGIVRDAALGRSNDDLDVSVGEQGERLARELAEASGGTFVALGGDRFSSYRVVAGPVQADLWDREGSSLEADLERRDLTINSIACALTDGRVDDPFGGLPDLAAKILRATKLDCFERDPLRVLRLARFRTRLPGFAIEKSTAAAARIRAAGLAAIAPERIREELDGVLAAGSTRGAFDVLRDLGALAFLIGPTAAPSATAELLAMAQRLDRFATALEAGRTGSDGDSAEPARREERRLAALAALSIAAGGGCAEAGAANLAGRGLATRRSLLTANRLLSGRLPRGESERRLFVLDHGTDWPLALAVSAAALEQCTPPALERLASDLKRTARANPELAAGLAPLLDGHAAARILDVEPGPAIGEALRRLVRAQALGLVRTQEQAEAFLRRRRSAVRDGGSDGKDLEATSKSPAGAC